MGERTSIVTSLLLRPPDSCYPSGSEVRRACFGPGLWPGPRRQARWVGRGLRRQGWALAPIAMATRPQGAPLTLEGPTRTMRGVPAPVSCDLSPGDGHTWRDADGLVLLVSRDTWVVAAGGRLRPVTGPPCAAAAAPAGPPPEGRERTCRAATARSPANAGRWSQVIPAAQLTPKVSAPTPGA